MVSADKPELAHAGTQSRGIGLEYAASFPSDAGGLLAALCGLAALAGASTTSAAPAPKLLATFTVDRSGTTPVNVYTWTVPKGVRKVTFDAFGASGRTRPCTTSCLDGDAVGGAGGQATGTFRVRSGTVFQIVVGGTPTASDCGNNVGGLNGGGDGGCGGGGGSDVRAGSCAAAATCTYTDRIVVAGGGGGTFTSGGGGPLGSWSGGSGGGVTGGDGESSGAHGGTQTSGGAGDCNGGQGAFGEGGDWTGTDEFGSSGGGGGWYGGGGGCGGGGGSGFVDPLALSSFMQNGVQTGDGEVVIYKG